MFAYPDLENFARRGRKFDVEVDEHSPRHFSISYCSETVLYLLKVVSISPLFFKSLGNFVSALLKVLIIVVVMKVLPCYKDMLLAVS
jgi:hypothetical protein